MRTFWYLRLLGPPGQIKNVKCLICDLSKSKEFEGKQLTENLLSPPKTSWNPLDTLKYIHITTYNTLRLSKSSLWHSQTSLTQNGCLKVFWGVQGCLGEMRLCKDAFNGILVRFPHTYHKFMWFTKGSHKKKTGKKRSGWPLGLTPPPPPPKRSGKCKNFSTSCHIWGYFAIL